MRMFGRLFWLALGGLVGYQVAVRVQQAKGAADRLRPARMREDLAGSVKSAATQVRSVIKDLASDNLAS